MFGRFFFVFFFIIIVSSVSHGGLLIGPYAGYIAEGKTSSDKTSDKYQGMIIGGKLGVNGDWVMAGVDYSVSKYKDVDVSHNGANDNIDAKNLGAFLGFELPVLFQVWGTLFFDVSKKYTDDYNNVGKKSGSGHGFGIGITSFPLINLNLEYRKLFYDSYKNISVSDTFVASHERTADLNIEELIITVSIPIDL